ncbi:F-box protein PP2-B10-like isoform X2 [Nicotiana sylvestris]|uniref:F-box protein PP2-B10-like isoform X2 n=1 Tax=Nicotiana sylvestris TaxID=4096 RepID=UPI00388C732F
MNYFQRLPEGCILEILSRTTPVDAVRSCILSRGFKTALESEIIWERFLPSDYQEIIERSEFPSVCTTKKELYFSLCEYPILLDGGKLSFSLDKHSGKKCFMVAPRELIISWGDNLNHWQWKPHPDSRKLGRNVLWWHQRKLLFHGSIHHNIGDSHITPNPDSQKLLISGVFVGLISVARLQVKCCQREQHMSCIWCSTSRQMNLTVLKLVSQLLNLSVVRVTMKLRNDEKSGELAKLKLKEELMNGWK